MKVILELTDTFSGEANYSWVKRETLDLPADTSDLSIVRKAKEWAGLTGYKCRKENYGLDFICLHPQGICQVLFITFQY
jgi:hypothetical protein